MRYCIIENVPRDRLSSYCLLDEEFRQILSSPYLVSNKDRIWYKDCIYYDLTLDEFFKYVLHGDEDEY